MRPCTCGQERASNVTARACDVRSPSLPTLSQRRLAGEPTGDGGRVRPLRFETCAGTSDHSTITNRPRPMTRCVMRRFNMSARSAAQRSHRRPMRRRLIAPSQRLPSPPAVSSRSSWPPGRARTERSRRQSVGHELSSASRRRLLLPALPAPSAGRAAGAVHRAVSHPLWRTPRLRPALRVGRTGCCRFPAVRSGPICRCCHRASGSTRCP